MKQFHIGITVALSMLFFSAPVIGQSIYRWTDELGHVHFSNAPVKEAQSVDDDLPPASNFGGAQDIFSSPEETPPSAEQPGDASQPRAALPPSDGVSEDDEDIADSDESTGLERSAVTTEEEPGSEEPMPEENGMFLQEPGN